LKRNERKGFTLDRRRFLELGVAGALCAAPLPVWAGNGPAGERRLSFLNLHTGERLKAAYWADGAYVTDALQDINYLLRDFRTDEVLPIDPRLLDYLFAVRSRLGVRQPFEVISGYRSPQTNAMLVRRSSGVAKKSLHTKGMAIDIRLSTHDVPTIARAALDLRRGGVGLYSKSNFVHLDIGRFRRWGA